MSLKVWECTKLGIDNQNARWREVEPGENPGATRGNRRASFFGAYTRRDIRLDRSDVERTWISETRPGGERNPEGIHREGDWNEHGADDAIDRQTLRKRIGAGTRIPSSSI